MWDDLEKNGLPPNTDAVINLAGSNIMDFKKLWTCEVPHLVRIRVGVRVRVRFSLRVMVIVRVKGKVRGRSRARTP